MALFAGSAAALAMLSMPVALIELAISSTGLSEIIAGAAPPLGFTARALLAGFAGLLGMGVSLAFASRPASDRHGGSEIESPARQSSRGEGIMGFALSKLTAFTRSRSRAHQAEDAAETLPVLRRADSHPDAPARRPIFASRDFGGTELFNGPVSAAAEAENAHTQTDVPDVARFAADLGGTPYDATDVAVDDLAERFDFVPAPVADTNGFTMPRAPEPLDDRTLLTDAIMTLPEEASALSEAEAPSAPHVLLEDLSITDLVDRFERGIARRKMLSQAAAAVRKIDDVLAQTGSASVAQPVLADIPPAPRVDVREDVDAEVDEALRAALGALHQMTSR